MKNSLEPVTYSLPEFWACALINGDNTGMNDEEIKQMNDFLSANNLPAPVECSEEGYFSWSNDAFRGIGCTCLDYTFLIPVTE